MAVGKGIGIGIGKRSPLLKGVPAGYSRTTTNGVAVTFNGKPVYDNGKDFFVRA